ncbi:extracellular solute-binding protein [Iocasia frigidifontis]|uniref:Extracellular solute-binding protein n=1 Tax=Iocasia fonsfrigidae TaxID=2682810 RepID=A0A8A7KJP2_9FIRM|nr:ABC transporter substrate-binding protein [Iocasia fonsfrigidae]QTM00089.1 extracellular solute-binding protein [Iocasia fonsfrigidae]
MKKFSVVMLLCLMIGLFNLTVLADSISVYTSLDEQLARVVFNEYTAETGVKIEWVRLSTGEAVSRMMAEKNNPQASIWVGGVGLGHIQAKDSGLTIPYVAENAQYVPDNFKDEDNYWMGIYAGPLCFVSNTQRLEELGLAAPTSWADLIKPEYEGYIQVANPGTSGTSYNVLATMVQLMGEEEGFEYMKKLDKNIVQYTRSGSKPGKNAAIGEVPIGIGYAHDQVKLKAQGYPLVITFPEEGGGYEVASISLIKNGKETELAKELYNWLLSKKAAEIYASFYVVPFRDVKLMDGAVPISEVNTIDQDDVWAGNNKERLVEKWNEEVYSQH